MDRPYGSLIPIIEFAEKAEANPAAHSETVNVKEKNMNKRIVTFIFFMVFLLVATGCATFGSAGHRYFMKGQVMETTDGQAYLCIGSAEGADVGQEFTVYRYEKTGFFPGKRSPAGYTREQVGAIRISKVVDEHFAWATVLTGRVAAGDIAELPW